MATTGTWDRGFYRIQLTVGGSTAADMASVLNPTGEAQIVTYCAINATHESTGAATMDVGIGSSASTSYDNLIDGQSVAAAGVFADLGTNGKRAKLWPAAEYLTASEATGDVAGFTGELLVQFAPRTATGTDS